MVYFIDITEEQYFGQLCTSKGIIYFNNVLIVFQLLKSVFYRLANQINVRPILCD